MKIAVLGDGGWGTALALTLTRNGHAPHVWGPDAEYMAEVSRTRNNWKFLPDVPLPETIAWSSHEADVLDGAEAVIVVTPSKFLTSVLERFHAPYQAAGRPPVISATKGFDPAPPHHRPSQLIAEAWGDDILSALSGPSIAGETARGVPTAVTIASTNPDTGLFFQSLFNSDSFRVYTGTDIIGLELGGALKNVIALAGGICDGLGFGANAKAALITRGLAEMRRLGIAMGAQEHTFYGLAGIGDLMVTCSSPASRNRSVGERLGRGEALQDILSGMVQVAEGVCTCGPALDLAREHQVETPVMQQVGAILSGQCSPRQAVCTLMQRDPRAEHDD